MRHERPSPSQLVEQGGQFIAHGITTLFQLMCIIPDERLPEQIRKYHYTVLEQDTGLHQVMQYLGVTDEDVLRGNPAIKNALKSIITRLYPDNSH